MIKSRDELSAEYRVINDCRLLLLKRLTESENELISPPLGGWSQEKHNAYHTKEIQELKIAIRFLFVELMRISPD